LSEEKRKFFKKKNSPPFFPSLGAWWVGVMFKQQTKTATREQNPQNNSPRANTF
jgi:hypothetical protein